MLNLRGTRCPVGDVGGMSGTLHGAAARGGAGGFQMCVGHGCFTSWGRCPSHVGWRSSAEKQRLNVDVTENIIKGSEMTSPPP
jgi:hypothetical protein